MTDDRRDHATRRDMLLEMTEHIAEERNNRLVMVEMRDNLRRLSDMHYNITTEEHQTLIDWWRDEIRIRRSRREMWDRVKQSTAGWLAIAILGGIAHLGQPIGKYLIEKISAVQWWPK